MKNRSFIAFFALGLLVAASPVFAAATGYKDIAWIKVTPDGVLVALADFNLNDYDASTCADPGQAYFYLPNSAKNYQERYAAILSAVTADRQISIAYWSCGVNPGVQPMLSLGNINYR